MFDTLLVANRGEIACRVMETARAMGLRCVAVYSEADRAAKHVAMADVAVCIGGSAPAESYLRGDRIIKAALETGAQAVHPGYGFLSENPEFVDAVEAAGLTFVGPSAKAIRAMGLKDAAKAVMEAAGVPVVPGYHGAAQGDARLAEEAAKIGFPVLIKAVAGGGGKGMRRVDDAADFDAALASARVEAQAAFGNADVLIEKWIDHPRHIEVQVFGDGTRAVHLFERDCSLQRRHQKVIEEAPAPGMTQEMRAAMGAAAVRAAEAIAYRGAGTVEFIVDGSNGLKADGFYFMEMNTRLQVEHPVTEAITGVDLVAWQLRVAAGEDVPKAQDELFITGHAFEARLYAEDVPKGFLPATGTLTTLAFDPVCRADAGVQAGDSISSFYDPMIAKVIVHGPTRAVALAKLQGALRRCQVAGTVTNLAFLGALAGHAGFGRGDVDTGLIARDLTALTTQPPVSPRLWVAAGMAAMGMTASSPLTGFHLWQPLRHHVVLEQGGMVEQIVVEVSAPDRQRWEVQGHTLTAMRQGQAWLVDGQPLPQMAQNGDIVTLFENYGIVFRYIDPLDRADAAAAAGNVIEAPMPGLVRAMDVRAGQPVTKGQRLAVLEAMKMEHALLAGRDGVVAEVLAETGAQVEAGAALVRLEDEEAA
ncbi:MAG: biotin carboxylase N-terminal domain-containing protein [Pseudomonadota bacterium]